MSDVDELAELLRLHQPETGMRVAMGATCRCRYWSETQDLEQHRADAILAAGWRAPEHLILAGWMSPSEQLLGRPYEPQEPMRKTMATVLLNESSHRDEYFGKDLPGDWWEYVYDWEQGSRNPEDWTS